VHLAYRGASVAQRLYLRCRLDPSEYIRRWSFQRQMCLTSIPGRRWGAASTEALEGTHRATRRPPERRTRAPEATARGSV
jgi:hypothetical protein